MDAHTSYVRVPAPLRLTRLALLLMIFAPTPAAAATLPTGFVESPVAGGLQRPTAMAVAPDGRLFICEQAGRLRVVEDGVLLAAPFVTLTVNSSGERGLLGVAFDPAFETNGHVYVYYTATAPVIHNRVSRFTASGNVAVPGSEVVLMDLEPLSTATNHNGGAIHFGVDGRLFIAVGENANRANAQTLANRLGKMLRINANGSIPTDNPFYNTATGVNRAIWALGLRNPFTFAIQPLTGTMFINDVGENTWEEINEGVAGANYGWPATEGPTSDLRFKSPLYAYDHSQGCAISGAAFYNPEVATFPAEYGGSYFFADLCGGWIRRRAAGTGVVTQFASGISQPVDLQVASDGALYYLARGTGTSTGAVFRVEFRQAPRVNLTANGVDGPLALAPEAPLRIAVSFDAGSTIPLDQAEVYFAVATSFGVFWFDPATLSFVVVATPLYSGPLASTNATLLDLPGVQLLPPGPYVWVVIVDTDSDGVPDGHFADAVLTFR
jgi:glucose/arabinose dehydrogenase